jgi:hypothetical protein
LSTKRWYYFFLNLGRILILLILLAVLLPKLAEVCNIWLSSRLYDEQRPIGNPMRVETPGWGKFVFKLFPTSEKEE